MAAFTSDISTTDRYRLREMADHAALTQSETNFRYVELYAAGVEDVLRFIVGDAAPTADLADVLRGVV